MPRYSAYQYSTGTGSHTGTAQPQAAAVLTVLAYCIDARSHRTVLLLSALHSLLLTRRKKVRTGRLLPERRGMNRDVQLLYRGRRLGTVQQYSTQTSTALGGSEVQDPGYTVTPGLVGVCERDTGVSDMNVKSSANAPVCAIPPWRY